MMLFKRRIRRSWIDFGLNIVRGPRPPHLIPTGVVRLYIGILAVPLLVPPLPPPTSPTPHIPLVPTFPVTRCHTEISSVDV
jgi:hypothetical protein